jgi:hypothetical protein
VLVAALACPQPPLLLPGLTGAADVEPELRAACRAGLKALAASEPDVVVLVGGAPGTQSWPGESPRGIERFGYGGGSAPGEPLPLSLAVGMELLDDAGWVGLRELQSVAASAPLGECLELGRRLAGQSRRVALLVMGDGSARRGLKAPGYLDELATGYDERALAGLAGDLQGLRSLEPELGEQLLVAGRAAWQVLAGAAETAELEARIRYAADPFGVLYVVSSWGGRES